MISFTLILWNLSGDLTLFGITMPRAMFWIAFIYVLIATIIAFWIGRPIIRLSFDNEKLQRRVPLRAGALARRLGVGGLLPRRSSPSGAVAQAVPS